MGWDALAGVVIGGAIGLVSALAIELRRERRDALTAARMIQSELIGITLLAHGFPDDEPFPYPFEERAWIAQRDRLAGARLSDDDWITLMAFYVTNDLVAKGAMTPATCAKVEGESMDAGKVLGRLLRKRWWHRFRDQGA